MPMPRSVTGYEVVHITLPRPEYARLESHLHSEVQGRVPWGAMKNFFTERVREYFERRVLDLSPYVPVPPGTLTISGTQEAIDALRKVLERTP